MSDSAETWWEASGRHGDSELLKLARPIANMAAFAAILKIFKRHLFPNRLSRHWNDLEVQNC